jgi:hypothetical protein
VEKIHTEETKNNPAPKSKINNTTRNVNCGANTYRGKEKNPKPKT